MFFRHRIFCDRHFNGEELNLFCHMHKVPPPVIDVFCVHSASAGSSKSSIKTADFDSRRLECSNSHDRDSAAGETPLHLAEVLFVNPRLCNVALEMSILIFVILTQYLEDNERLIRYILECINAGRVEEAVTQQQRLQQNLMWLAGIADSQAPPTPSASAPAQVHSPPCFINPRVLQRIEQF